MTRTATHGFGAAVLVAAAVALLGTAGPRAQTPAPGTGATASVGGNWKVSLHGQHVIPVGMELTQDGARVTGTLMLWNGDVDLHGGFTGRVLTATGTLTPNDGSPGGERRIEATLADDGTLDGTIAMGSMGMVKLTAERFRERPMPAKTPTQSAPASGPAAAFAGTWALGVSMGAETQTFRLTLTASGASLTGVLGSDHTGALTLQDTRLEGDSLDFAVPMAGTTQLVVFHATRVSPDTLQGTLTGPMGAMPFTGTRAK